MNFKVKSQTINLDCSFDGATLLAEGLVSRDYKYLQFSVNNTCLVKFNGNKFNGIIQNFTQNHVVIKINESINKVSFEEFIILNADTEICFRIEKNKVGPYQNPDVSPEFKTWISKQIEAHQVRRWNGENEHQPSLFEDRCLSHLAPMVELVKFAFKDYEQLFKWFSLEEVQLMVKEGFNITPVQKGRDYFDSLISHHQAILAETENHFKVINSVPAMIPYD